MTVIISIFALALSFATIMNSIITRSVQTHLEDRRQFEASKGKVSDAYLLLIPLLAKRETCVITEQEDLELKLLLMRYEEALERNINTLEIACGNYLNSKIKFNSVFKSYFYNELKDILNEDSSYEYLNQDNPMIIRAIIKLRLAQSFKQK
ncbi:hypothetical protein [Paenibacillus taichungensis]